MPGLIDPMQPAPTRLEFSSALDALTDQAGNLVGQLAAHNLNTLGTIQQSTDALATKLSGPVLGQLNALEMRAQKSAAKLQKERNRLMGNAYQSVFPFGGSWQPIEHVAAGLAMGDIYGPVGLVDPQATYRGIVDPLPVGDGGGGEGKLPGAGPLPPYIDPGWQPIPGNGLPPASGGPTGIPIDPITGNPQPMGFPPVGGFNPGPGGGGWVNLPPGVNPPGAALPPPPPPPPPPVPGPIVPPPVPVPKPDPFACNLGPTLPSAGQYPQDPSFNVDFRGFPIPNAQCQCPVGWAYKPYDPLQGPAMCLPMGGNPGPGGEPLPSPNPPGPGDPIVPPPPQLPPVYPPETCPPPTAPPACAPNPKPVDQPSDFGDDFCSSIANFILNLVGSTTKPEDWFGMAKGNDVDWIMGKGINTAITGQPDPLLPGLLARAKEWSIKTNRAAVESLNANSKEFAVVSIARAVVDLINSYLHIIPPQFQEALAQASNTIVQSKIPTQPGADQAYLNNAITEETWRCWTEANGNFLKPAGDVMYGQRAKPNAKEVDLLYRRGLLDEEAYNTKMRSAGVLTADDQGDIANLNLQYPDRGDLIRFMVRDVFDEDVVTRSGLSVDFDKKFTGDALKYADALGIPRKHMEYAWRAHWQLPSLTMAGQMLARCRPGRVPDDAVVTEDDVVQLLKQNDWAPKWIPSMMEIVKQPLTRVDTRRMYQLHAATEQDLKEYYLDLRYDELDADKLVQFAKAQRDVAEAKASGLPGQRTAIQQFARGELTSDELDKILQRISLTPELAQQAKQSAELARQVYQRTQIIKSTKRLYVAGLIDDDGATQELLLGEVDGDAIEELLNLWQLDRAARGKHASAAQLCAWRADNIISPADQLHALVRTGWSVDDANRIVSQCDLTLSEKARKAAERAAKESMKLIEKEQAAALKELKQKGKIPGPPTRRIVVVRSQKGQTVTDTTIVPVLPADGDIVAAGGNP